MFAMLMLLGPSRGLASINARLQQGIAAGENIFQLIDEKNEVDDGKIKKIKLPINIRFKNVNFTYDTQQILYDISLARCPELLILDYGIIKTGPPRTLVAGIGDAIAKWYEASVSSGHSEQTMIISAVQQARVLRDILFQKSTIALEEPGGETWEEVVDATVLLAGLIGGIGGAQCRTVAAHAIHNGLTHLSASHGTLHGEKVAYGILAQLRLEEMLQGNQLAVTARQQLLKFYNQIGLPKSLNDLGLKEITLSELSHVAEVACHPNSDIHRLPFRVVPEQLVAAMVSTTVPLGLEKQNSDLGTKSDVGTTADSKM